MTFLKFCRDGILRRSKRVRTEDGQDWETVLLPVQAWEQSFDSSIFLKSLHDKVVFENGLTIGELLLNLEPWANTMTGIANMDFPAFLAEMRESAKPDAEISRIELSYQVSISPVVAFDRTKGNDILDKKTGIFDLGSPIKTGRLEIDVIWSASARLHPDYVDKYEGAEFVSLSFTPLSEWQHVPIVFIDSAEFIDETASENNAVYLGTNQSLTHAKHQNVETTLSSEGEVISHNIAIDPPTPDFFNAVICGFLWDLGFYYSPEGRNKSRDQVMESMNELNKQKDIAKNTGEESVLTDSENPVEQNKDLSDEDKADRKILRMIQDKAREMGFSESSGKPAQTGKTVTDMEP